MSMRLPAFIAVALLAAVALACGAAEDQGPARRFAITLTNAGCSPSSLTMNEGRVTFAVSNPSSARITSFEVREDGRSVAKVTNVIGGLSRNLTTTLAAGSYTMNCGNAPGGPLVVGERPLPTGTAGS